MSFDPTVIRTTDQFKALAHPLRMAIMERLTLDGPLTASDLGDALGETPANCSWHLRKLAEHGFVEETGDGQGRRRPWRVTHVGLTWDDDVEPTPGYRAASQRLRQTLVQRQVARFLEHSARPASGPAWGDAGMMDTVAYVTEEEAKELAADLQALLLRHHDRLGDPSRRPPDARALYVLTLSSVDPSQEPQL